MRPLIYSGLPARSRRRFRLERKFEIRDDKAISEIELRLPPVPEVTTGMIAFSWDQARDVLRGWHAVTAVDDALDVMFGAMATPDGTVKKTVVGDRASRSVISSVQFRAADT